MSGQISWKISFENIDPSIKKLERINELLDSIGRKSGGNGGLAGGAIVPKSPTNSPGSGGTGISEIAIGAAIAQAFFNSTLRLLKTKSIQQAISQFPKSPPGSIPPYLPLTEQVPRQGSFLSIRTHKHLEKLAKEVEEERKKRKDLARLKGTGGIDIGTGAPDLTKLHGGLSGFFDIFKIAFRTIQKSMQGSFTFTLPHIGNPFKNMKLGNLKGLGSIFNAVLGRGGIGSLVTSFLRFGPIIGAVTGAFYLLYKAAKLLAEGIQHGAEAYKNAARYGKSVEGTSQLLSAFKSIGIEGVDTSLLQGQFNKKSGKFQEPGIDVILGAARAGQFGNVQEWLNLEKEFRAAFKDAATSAESMKLSSKASFDLNMDGEAISREWKALLSDIAALMYPVLHAWLETVKNILKILEIAAQFYIEIGQKLYLIPRGNTSFSRMSGGGQGPTFTSLEKIGFVMKGASTDNSIKKTADNTSQMVISLNKLVSLIQVFVGANDVRFSTSLSNLPSLP